MFNVNLISSRNSIDKSKDDFINSLYTVDYNTFYRAYVVDNNDLSGQGKVKIRIPAIHKFSKDNPGFVNNNSLPWASPAIFNSAGNDSGSYLIPNNGDVVYVAFEGGNADLPIYFGGVISKKGNNEKKISSYDINNNQVYTYNDDDMIKDIVHGTERVIYKSLKGATILVDDYDGEEKLKILDQSGQMIIMENFEGNLGRRGNDTGLSSRSKITITNNQGDKITLKNDKIYMQSNTISIETKSIDKPGIDRNFLPESELLDIINKELVVEYNDKTDSNAIVYTSILDEIIGAPQYLAENKTAIRKAIELTNEINGTIISKEEQTKFGKYMVEYADGITVNINNEEFNYEEIKIKYILNTYLNGAFKETFIREITKGDLISEDILPEYENYILKRSMCCLPEIIENNYQVVKAYYVNQEVV